MPEPPLPVPYRLFRHFYCVPRALCIIIVFPSLHFDPRLVLWFLLRFQLDPRLRGDDDFFVVEIYYVFLALL